MNKEIGAYQFIENLKALKFVDEIWLYGSRARGDNAPRADIDLAVVCPRATQTDWHGVLHIIEEADTLLSIDCVRFDELKQSNPFRANILRDHKVLFTREP